MIVKERLISRFKKNSTLFHNFFNLGFIQASNAVLQILLFPLIIHAVGLESFGFIAVGGTYGGFLALIVNYGSNLSGIKEVALGKGDPVKLSHIFSVIIYTRALLFLISLVIPFLLFLFSYKLTPFLFFATTIVFSEVLNPLFFFNGIEKLFLYNCANLAAKIISAVLIIFLIKSSSDALWVNFYLGISNAFLYGLLTVYAVRKFGLKWTPFSAAAMLKMLSGNFYLVCNNIATQLQQSFFLFMLSATVSPMTLGAYSLCDKVIWSFRMILIAFSSAIYPKASIAYHENKERWYYYKRKIRRLLSVAFVAIAFLIYFFAPLAVWILTGEYNSIAIIYIKSICIVPLLAALNSMNVIELLIRNLYRYMFYCSLVLMAISVIAAFLFTKFAGNAYFGLYPILVEASSVLVFMMLIRKADLSNHTGSPTPTR